MEYIGEHLWPGIIGNLFVALSFTGALLATFSFYQASKKDAERGWASLGKLAFKIHSLAIVGIILTMFLLLVNHYFEYNYAHALYSCLLLGGTRGQLSALDLLEYGTGSYFHAGCQILAECEYDRYIIRTGVFGFHVIGDICP